MALTMELTPMAQNIRSALDRFFKDGKIYFPKLQGGGSPYRFERWDRDKSGTICLYYSFLSSDVKTRHEKRIPLEELAGAVETLTARGLLTRSLFEEICPIAQSAGLCGYAVVGWCLEMLGIAEYKGTAQGFRLVANAWDISFAA